LNLALCLKYPKIYRVVAIVSKMKIESKCYLVFHLSLSSIAQAIYSFSNLPLIATTLILID